MEPEQKCPNCNEPEDKKIVCRHCGYEYKELDIPNWIFLGAVFLLFIWIVYGERLRQFWEKYF